MVRTRAPQAYEKTITNYLAFRIRGTQKNAQLTFGQPEPGSCSLDGYVNSIRGWVVPVVHETRTGELTGKETIKITTKQYYFWFLGDTIAGITPRMELCPGIEATFSEGNQATGATPPPTSPAGADTPEQAKGDPAQSAAKPARTKKTGKSSKNPK